MKESSKQEAALESSSSSSASITTINSTITSNISITTTATTSTTPTTVTTSSSTFSDNLALSRLGSVELSFQSQLGSELSQAFPEFQNITEGKEKIRPVLATNCDTATFINRMFQIRMCVIRIRKSYFFILCKLVNLVCTFLFFCSFVFRKCSGNSCNKS